MSKKDISSPSKEKEDFMRKIRSITPERFTDFFKEKGITHLTCPICKRGNVAIPTIYNEPQNSFDYVVPSLTDRPDNDDSYDLSNYSYKILCKNCAHEMYFNVSSIISWAEESKEDHDE
ncbi:hypothetical protein KKI90_15200 [Xenorhabdus bovienii]|uniref:hypothetical protein n=1 Tax=Xenorhabdus bovienii TaxID=40576 RepID=UPI00237CEE69|nr:hypothetical protein [Xenorhabdus bovienii]MDE1487657.1 hypothetical protein [Xenorhabdus bovienii]MDE9478601.1 hypothetical protein [Xenorhabdus bovienii]MDE9531840.1 hypothetical protein [Xenorhabdus bovienii]MDE9570979.1 hypothetical protein [Xenorhabdus bovienii]